MLLLEVIERLCNTDLKMNLSGEVTNILFDLLLKLQTNSNAKVVQKSYKIAALNFKYGDEEMIG